MSTVLLIIMISCPDNWTYFRAHRTDKSKVPGIVEDFKTSKDFEKCRVGVFAFDIGEGDSV